MYLQDVHLLYCQFKPQTNLSIHLKHGNKRQKYSVMLSLQFLIIVYFAYDLSSPWYSTQEVGEQCQWSQQVPELM